MVTDGEEAMFRNRDEVGRSIKTRLTARVRGDFPTLEGLQESVLANFCEAQGVSNGTTSNG